MYSSSAYYADPTPPPPPRPLSSYDPYGDRHSSPYPTHANGLSAHPPAPTSRPTSFAGYPQSPPPNHRHSYAPPAQSYAQPASPPAVSIHDYSRPAHAASWPHPQQPHHRRRSSDYDQGGASSLGDSFGRLSMVSPTVALDLTAVSTGSIPCIYLPLFPRSFAASLPSSTCYPTDDLPYSDGRQVAVEREFARCDGR